MSWGSVGWKICILGFLLLLPLQAQKLLQIRPIPPVSIYNGSVKTTYNSSDESFTPGEGGVGNALKTALDESISIFQWDWEDEDTNIQNLSQFLRKGPLVNNEADAETPSQMITINKTDPKDGYNLQRENATFMILCRNEDVYDLLETVQYLHDRYNHQYHYDFTFLNDEPFTKDFIYLLSSYIPKGNLNFGSIPKSHWSYPSFIDQQRAMQNRENSGDMPYGDSESYRHMCRFFAGFFYKHPFIRQYQYYWRIEPGIKFYCDVKYDVFKFMRENSKKYSFVLSLFEYRDTLPSLWDYVKDYMKSQDISNQDAQLIDLVQNNNQFESYNLCHFWSNFEIADLAMFDNDRYNDFFNFLDEKGGFFYERWGDAPIHSIAVSLFLSKSDLHWFDDIGYYHSPYLQCPQDSATYLQNRCTCNPDEDFSYSDLSCTSHFLDVISSDNTGSSH